MGPGAAVRAQGGQGHGLTGAGRCGLFLSVAHWQTEVHGRYKPGPQGQGQVAAGLQPSS